MIINPNVGSNSNSNNLVTRTLIKTFTSKSDTYTPTVSDLQYHALLLSYNISGNSGSSSNTEYNVSISNFTILKYRNVTVASGSGFSISNRCFLPANYSYATKTISSQPPQYYKAYGTSSEKILIEPGQKLFISTGGNITSLTISLWGFKIN